MNGKICVKLLVIGKIKEEFYREKLMEYYQELNKKCQFKVIELSDESIPSNPSPSMIEKVKACEGDKVLEQICGNDYVIALCIEGESTDCQQLKKQLKKAWNSQRENVVFVIGGSLGLDSRIIRRANYKLSFSNMTFPHQLMRVMLVEQLKKAICDM